MSPGGQGAGLYRALRRSFFSNLAIHPELSTSALRRLKYKNLNVHYDLKLFHFLSYAVSKKNEPKAVIMLYRLDLIPRHTPAAQTTSVLTTGQLECLIVYFLGFAF